MSAPKPWWQNNPTIIELRRRALAEIEAAADEPEPSGRQDSDPVVDEFYSGACMRALANARDNLATARAAYDNARAACDSAVRNARAAGLSWGEIGAMLGVSKQQLHRRIRKQL